jgi:hypothetical protein
MNKFIQYSFKIPNPLWWVVGYGVVLPYRYLKYKLDPPKPTKPNLCECCGDDQGESLWEFCSPECFIKLNTPES